MSGKHDAGIPMETAGLQPVDIRAPRFFWLLQPWREGKLVTIDGWGRFAEISFRGANRIEIKQLVDFPRAKMDRQLITWPEAGLITSSTAERMHHLAAIDDKKTKSHIPLLTWRHIISAPVLLDPVEGLVGYCYSMRGNNISTTLLVYNYKEDKIVYESPEDFTISFRIAMNERYSLCGKRILNGRNIEAIRILYDWRTNEIIENDLTEAINRNGISLIIRPDRNIHLGKRILFGYSNILKKEVKITWNEEYSDINVTPLDYLVPRENRFDDFILSADGTWGATFISGYRGIYDERLYKRAFFHLDDRYPNGISMPVITEDFEDYQWDYSAFVKHPVHGMCFAQEWHKDRHQYLRLYKMDAVLEEINRQLLEAASEIAR